MVTIYFYDGYNGRGDLQTAIGYASEMIKKHYAKSGFIYECFAFLYDTVKQKRYILWLDNDLCVQLKKL